MRMKFKGLPDRAAERLAETRPVATLRDEVDHTLDLVRIAAVFVALAAAAVLGRQLGLILTGE